MAALLCLDTSTENLYLALFEDGKVVSEKIFPPKTKRPRHGEVIITEINQMLEEANLNFSDLAAIAFSIGPGSYTGLRVAAATVLGLVGLSDKKIYAVPCESLEASKEENLAASIGKYVIKSQPEPISPEEIKLIYPNDPWA